LESTKQNELTAGSIITIDGNTIFSSGGELLSSSYITTGTITSGNITAKQLVLPTITASISLLYGSAYVATKLEVLELH